MGNRKLSKNEDAVSVSVGFILMFSITVFVFIAIIFSFYTLSQRSERAVMQESFDILGSELAVRMTTIDSLVNIADSYGGTVNTLEYDFSIPAYIAEERYTVNINNSTNQIIMESDNGAKAWIPFNSSINLIEGTIFSGADNYQLNYKSNSIITNEEQ